MSIDEAIAGLSAEADDVFRQLLKRAYERGFREALASTGEPPAPEPMQQPVVPDPLPILSPVKWAEASGGAAEEILLEEDEGEGEEEADEALVVRPILPHATVGTLRRRINRAFDLERFEIDVVICRRGDPDRRQLKSTARLGLYRREEP
ncbi:MAG: hypothetical protein HYZ28_14225 [Myxococcales bacterium]|nr:hypothetical protein [Myxococcales bacterium]